MANKNVYVDINQDNIFIVDPNRVFNDEGLSEPRYVNQDELVMYVNLECDLVPRSRLISGTDNRGGRLLTIATGTVNFLKPSGKDKLTTDWTELVDVQTGGPSIINNELLGITRLNYRIKNSYIASCTMTLEDVRGRALFESGDNSVYSAFFNFPPPIFYLTLKGYYGKALKTRLWLKSFNASVNTANGNFELQLEFTSEVYGILKDIQYGAILAVPQMYTKRVSTNIQNSPVANTNQSSAPVNDVVVNGGYEKMKLVYDNYKKKKLIPEDFPVITIQQLINKLDNFVFDTLVKQGKQSFTSYTDFENYKKIIQQYMDEVSLESNSWSAKYMDTKNPFIVTENNINYKVLTFKPEIKDTISPLNELEEIVNRFNKQLNENSTFGNQGSKKISFSITIRNLTALGFVQTDINDFETLKLRNNGVDPTEEQINNFQNSTINTFANADSIQANGGYAFYRFNGANYFYNIIDGVRSQLNSYNKQIEQELSDELDKILESNKGIGFKPTLKNMMAVVFAQTEALLLLLDDVHVKAFNVRDSLVRKNAVTLGNLPQLSDVKNEPDAPVYPWPQFLVSKIVNGNETFQSEYPGDKNFISLTKANNKELWPEVEFVEEFIKGFTQRQLDPQQGQPTINADQVDRLLISGFDTQPSNIVYSNLEVVKFLFEIEERLQTISKYQGYTRSDYNQVIPFIAEAESISIVNAILTKSIELVKVLKGANFTPQSFSDYLRSITNNGQSQTYINFLRGNITTDYLKEEINNSFKILENDLPKIQVNSTKENTLISYLDSTTHNELSFTDLYPFIDNNWNKSNLANGNANYSFKKAFDTRYSLFFNQNIRKFANYTSESVTKYDGNTDTNRPFTDFRTLTNTITNPVNLDSFYTNRTLSEYVLTEGELSFENGTTSSMLNSPYFANALYYGIQNDRYGYDAPYKTAAYLFLNSLPLATLRESFRDFDQSNGVETGMIAANFKKFGAINCVPKLWAIKIGSIWNRYKYEIENASDYVIEVESSLRLFEFFNGGTTPDLSFYTTIPVNTGTNQYQINYNSDNVNITLYDLAYQGSNVVMNLGFYPYLINDIYYFTNNVNIFDPVTATKQIIETEINAKIAAGQIKIFKSSNASISEIGWSAGQNLFCNTWSILIKKIDDDTWVTCPSFGTTQNEIKNHLSDIAVNPSSAYNGSCRMLWGAPNYGYFVYNEFDLGFSDRYNKQILTGGTEQTAFHFNRFEYIEDIFSVFEKNELDSFESMFLDYVKSTRTTTDDFNFQTHLKTLLSGTYSLNGATDDVNIIEVQNKQLQKFSNQLKKYLNYNILISKANPTGYKERAFSSLSSSPLPDSQVEQFYDTSTANALPSQNNSITLSVSQQNYPEAWKTLKLYVGFSSIPELEYKDSGSYITDFFITMNIGFTPVNIEYYAPLIKIFASQKLLNNNLTKDNFTTLIDDYLSEQLTLKNEVFIQVFQNLKTKLPDDASTGETIEFSPVDAYLTKVELYDSFKALNDKWIGGNNYGTETLLEDVLLVDKANRNIADLIIADTTFIKKSLQQYSNRTSIWNIINDFVLEHNLIPTWNPNFISYYNQLVPTDNNTDLSDPQELFADKYFGTFDVVDYQENRPKMVCVYKDTPSSQLNNNNRNNGFNNDGFDLKNLQTPLVENLTLKDQKKDYALSNKVVGFVADFGLQNQSIFTNISLSQTQGEPTVESLDAEYLLATSNSGIKTTTQSISLLNIFKTRAYTCDITMLGNVMIQPNNYFILRNVPLFDGTYMITEVVHDVSNGSFETTITAFRMPVRNLPIVSPLLTTVKQTLLTSVQNAYENKVQSQQSETTTTTNKIQEKTNTSNIILNTLRPSDVQNCEPSNSEYQNYTSVTPDEKKFTLSGIASIVSATTTDSSSRKLLMIYLMAQTYNTQSSAFICYNNNLGNVSLDVTSKWGGNLPNLFSKEFICLINQSSAIGSYVCFKNETDAVKFINQKYIKKIYKDAVSDFSNADNFSQQFVKQLIVDTSANNDLKYYDEYKKTNPQSVTNYEKTIKDYFNLITPLGF